MAEYIEREALIEKIVNTPTVPIRQCYEGNFVYADGTASRQNEIIDYINKLPTADVVEVRHCEWTLDVHSFYKDTYSEESELAVYIIASCSNCGEKHPNGNTRKV